MKTDQFILALSADTLRGPDLRLALLLGIAPSLIVAFLAVWGFLGFRADLWASFFTPISVARIVLTLALGFVSIRLSLLLARPEGAQITRLWPLTAIAAVALALLLWAFVSTPQEARQMATVGKTMTTCLVSIPLLAVLPVASVLAALRKGATTAPARAGFAAGLVGGGLASAIYALHCTEDSPLFYVTWYGLAIMGVSAVSSLIGARLLRW